MRGVGQLDDIQGGLVRHVVAARVRDLIEGDQLGPEPAGLLHRVRPHLDPGAGSLLVGNGHGQPLDVGGLHLGLVGGNHIAVVKGHLRERVGQIFFLKSADHRISSFCRLPLDILEYIVKGRQGLGNGVVIVGHAGVDAGARQGDNPVGRQGRAELLDSAFSWIHCVPKSD